MPMRFLGLLMPEEWQMRDFAGRRSRRREGKRGVDHGALALGIADITVGPAKGMLNRRHPRHADKPLIGRNHIQRHGRNARRLNLPRNQSHGPATIRSNGCEENQVDLLADQLLRDRRRGLVLELT